MERDRLTALLLVRKKIEQWADGASSFVSMCFLSSLTCSSANIDMK